MRDERVLDPDASGHDVDRPRAALLESGLEYEQLARRRKCDLIDVELANDLVAASDIESRHTAGSESGADGADVRADRQRLSGGRRDVDKGRLVAADNNCVEEVATLEQLLPRPERRIRGGEEALVATAVVQI